MAETAAKKTATKDADTKEADGPDIPVVEFPEKLGNHWHPYREIFAVYASRQEGPFVYGSTVYEDGAWLVRDTENVDSVIEDDVFNATYTSIPPAKMDNETAEALSGVARL